jgi:hypothetical protein
MTSLYDDLPDVPDEPRERVHRQRLAVDSETLLESLNPQQRAAVLHQGRCSSLPAPARARRACSPTGSPG